MAVPQNWTWSLQARILSRNIVRPAIERMSISRREPWQNDDYIDRPATPKH